MTVTPPYEIFVGLRYLRAKRRHRTISLNTIVSVGGITLGVAALIGTLGIMTGFKEDLQAKILGTTSHIVIHDRTGESIADYGTLIKRLEEVPHVLAATPFVFRQVLLTSKSAVQGVVLRGIDPENEVRVTELGKNIASGRLEDLAHPERVARLNTPGASEEPTVSQPSALAKPKPRGIVLGKELSLRLGAFVGDSLNLVSPVGRISAVAMVPKIRTFTVVAVFESGMYEYDSSLAYIRLREAQEFFKIGDKVTGIEVKVDEIFKAAEIALSIQQALGFPYWARDWMQLNKNLFSALKLEKLMMFLLLVLITIVASFNIVSTLTMIVTEKQREIAILKAMGATRKSIMRIFMLHGVIIGLAGTLLGIPLGYTFLWLIETYWTFDPSVYYISHIPVHVQALDVILVSCVAILISFAATLLPSFQAAKLDPAAALRYE
ncbi:ABC transporter permease [Nitrospiraceae bacterium AH_259_D15_M11_P09]|nr:ABC transporter permease [Nitrospiraceae bacterium AH_259_D15_M11_P09]